MQRGFLQKMKFYKRKFVFKFISKVSGKVKKIVITKIMSNEELNELTNNDIKNIFWDHAIENNINVKNYSLVGHTVLFNA